MKKRKTQKKKNVLHLRILIPLLFLVIILGAAIFIRQTKGRESGIASDSEIPSLQLGTFNFAHNTPAPDVPKACNHDNGLPAEINSGKPVTDTTCSCISWLFECKNQKCSRYFSYNGQKTAHPEDCREQPNNPGGPGGLLDYYCGNSPAVVGLAPTDGTFCVGKPVIYLYPQKDTLVDVSVKTSGKIVVSDPLYPDGGWRGVLAHPGGKLEYQGKNYSELFYESNVKDFGKPTAGITLHSENIRGELDSIISKLGLVDAEKTEFLDWWVPKLKALNSKYIFFSVIEKAEKEKIDHVTYSPEPTTRIEFITYFKPLSQPFEGEKLDLPATPPQRIGFTAVEWGGILDVK